MEKDQIKLLYAEDDLDMAELNKIFFEFKGMNITHACDGDRAWDYFKENYYDVVLLDIRMPGKSGFDVARLIRSVNTTIPILFVSSLTSTKDVVAGLELGANDFIRKEFMIEEIEARIYAAIRTANQHRIINEKYYKISELTNFNFQNKTIQYKEKEIKLTPIEAKLLRYLCTRKEQIIERDALCIDIWNKTDYQTSLSLNKYISMLRKNLSVDEAIQINTFPKLGFQFTTKE